MTTTITTVGYGDASNKGFIDMSGNWAIEMCIIANFQFIGIVLFSSVTREIFSYKHLKTLDEITLERVSDMEHYLYDISSVLKNKDLKQVIIDLSKKSIEESIQNSTSIHFEENIFFQELPQNLKKRLVNSVLYHDIKKFKYFFHDFVGEGMSAPGDFILQVMTNLDSQLYAIGSVIVEFDAKVFEFKLRSFMVKS